MTNITPIHRPAEPQPTISVTSDGQVCIEQDEDVLLLTPSQALTLGGKLIDVSVPLVSLPKVS